MADSTNALIDTVILFTARMRELAEFYSRGLELDPPEPAGEGHLGMQIGDVHLGFDVIQDAPQRDIEGPASGVSLWFRVDDLEATVERFVSLGARVRYGRKEMPWGDVLASLYDLDGNIFGLAQRQGEGGGG